MQTRLIPQLQEDEDFVVLPVGRVSGDLPAQMRSAVNVHIFSLLASIDQHGGDPTRLADLCLSEFLKHLVAEDAEDGGQHWRFDPGIDIEKKAAGLRTQRKILIIDQFEEIFTAYPEHWEQRATFFKQLDQAMSDDPWLWVVLTLREDYVAALDSYAHLTTDRLRARFYMERLSAQAARTRSAVPPSRPADPLKILRRRCWSNNLRQTRVPGQEGMVLGQYVEPVQLQVVCYQLWEKLHGTHAETITTAHLSESDDIVASLVKFYETAVASVVDDPEIDVSEQQIRNWFGTRLITAAGTRGISYLDVQSGESEGLPVTAVNLLARYFLVRVELRSGGQWVELVHDRLVGPIEESNAAWSLAHQSTLQRRASIWDQNGRVESLVLQGTELQTMMDEFPEMPKGWAQYEQDYYRACVAAWQREKAARRNRLLLMGFVGTVRHSSVGSGASAVNFRVSSLGVKRPLIMILWPDLSLTQT